MSLIRAGRMAEAPVAVISPAWRLVAAGLALVLAAVTAVPVRALKTSRAQEEPALQILREAMGHEQDRAVLESCLARIDGEIQARPGFGLNHYAAGWILSHLGKSEEAVAAYDKAIKADPKIADAAYNAGVILAGLGREAEAARHWEAAIAADPSHIDALYNLGQLRYNGKQFAEALESWSKAHALAPSDFDIAKKVLQATQALGRREAAQQARAAVFAIWKASEDPKVRALTEYVFDQFDVGKLHVYAYETFEPKGELYYVYTFRAAGPDGKVVGTAQLESSTAIRDMGTPYILGVTVGQDHHTLKDTFKELPSYDVLRPLIIKVIEEYLAKLVLSASASF